MIIFGLVWSVTMLVIQLSLPFWTLGNIAYHSLETRRRED